MITEKINNQEPQLISLIESKELRRECIIRFECYIEMSDHNLVAHGRTRWYKLEGAIPIEEIKYGKDFLIGQRLKQMYADLEEKILNESGRQGVKMHKQVEKELQKMSAQ